MKNKLASIRIAAVFTMFVMMQGTQGFAAPTIDIWKGQQIGHFGGYYFPVSVGKSSNPTPTGSYTVKKKSKDYVSFKYKLPMPYSVFFTDAHAIHSGDVSTASRGCVRVPRPVAQWLFYYSQPGKTNVVVHP